MLCATQNVCSD